MTYTYAELELSPAAYDEISNKLVAAGYAHAFGVGHEHGDAIDMHGIGITREASVGKTLSRCNCDVGMCTNREDCRQK